MDDKPSLTYAIQYFDETSEMRAPYLICKGFVTAGWNVNIVTKLNSQNADINCAWGCVPIQKVGNGSHKNGILHLMKKMLANHKNHINLSWIWDWHCYSLTLSKIIFGKPYALALDTYTHLSPWDTNGFLSRISLELRYGIILRNAAVILAESPISYEYAKRFARSAEVLQVPVCLWMKDLNAVEQSWGESALRIEREQVILYAGRILPRKNLHDLIAAFADISNMFPEWTIEIRGPVTDQAYLSYLQKVMAKYNLKNRITFLPSLFGESLYRRYRSTSIYCLPSSGEGMPTAIIEAMYFGGAIVAAKSGAVGYQLDDGKCGLLFQSGDVEHLRNCLVQLMSSQADRIDYMQKARDRVLQTFIWENYFWRVEEAFRKRILYNS